MFQVNLKWLNSDWGRIEFTASYIKGVLKGREKREHMIRGWGLRRNTYFKYHFEIVKTLLAPTSHRGKTSQKSQKFFLLNHKK